MATKAKKSESKTFVTGHLPSSRTQPPKVSSKAQTATATPSGRSSSNNPGLISPSPVGNNSNSGFAPNSLLTHINAANTDLVASKHHRILRDRLDILKSSIHGNTELVRNLGQALYPVLNTDATVAVEECEVLDSSSSSIVNELLSMIEAQVHQANILRSLIEAVEI